MNSIFLCRPSLLSIKLALLVITLPQVFLWSELQSNFLSSFSLGFWNQLQYQAFAKHYSFILSRFLIHEAISYFEANSIGFVSEIIFCSQFKANRNAQSLLTLFSYFCIICARQHYILKRTSIILCGKFCFSLLLLLEANVAAGFPLIRCSLFSSCVTGNTTWNPLTPKRILIPDRLSLIRTAFSSLKSNEQLTHFLNEYIKQRFGISRQVLLFEELVTNFYISLFIYLNLSSISYWTNIWLGIGTVWSKCH